MSDAAALDQDARDRIVHRGLDEGLFVEAGAGTGKTTQLVGRVVALVVDRGVPLREIAAITFTEAAASELRDRIREELERRAATDEDPDVQLRCLTALADADVAAIGTLHSFAQRLLGEHPVEVGIPPRVEVLDEVRSAIEFQARWDEFVDELFDDPRYTATLVRAVLLDVYVDRIRGSSLRDVAVVFGESWDRLDRIASEEDLTPLPLARAAAMAALEAVRKLPEQCHDPDDKLLERLRANARDVDRVASALELADDDGLIQALRTKGKWAHGNLGRAAAWDDLPAAREKLKAADELCRKLIAQAADGVLRILASAVARFTKRAADERRQEGRLEFHDLLVLARRLLRTSPSARDALRRRYTRLLLDEFQDTDPIQIELAVLVASLPPSDEPSNEALGDLPWPLVPTDPERLFFVGDPKQSIYRFRRADIRLFLAARDRFGGQGAVALTRNFRTVPPVLDWVNHVFAEVMKDTDAHSQPGYTALVAERGTGESGASDHRVVLLGGPHEKGEKLKAGRLRELESADVARAVAAILRRPDDWPIYDTDCEKWRGPRPSEIAIMVPTRTSLAVLQGALEQRSVPYRLETGSLVYETQEIRDVFATIRVVVDPTDSIALVSALRSAVFGCSDTELFEYKAAGGRWDVRAEPPASLAGDHPVVEAIRVLRLLWEQRWWISPSELVERLIRERRLFELAFAHRRPRDAWRRLRFVLDQTRLFSESQGGDLVEFVAWSELQRRDTSRVHEPLLPETDDESVRIMTIHAAKGLEFPIAVVSGTTTQHGRHRAGVGVHFDDDDTVELRLKANLETERFDQRRDLEEEMDGQEKQRLLYVATTRARDHLLVSAHHNVGTESFAATIWRYSEPQLGTLCRRFVPPSAADDPLPSTAVVVAADPTDTAEARVEWIAERARMLRTQGASRSISATSIARAVEPDPTPELGADLAAEAAALAELEAEDAAADAAVVEELGSEAADGGEPDLGSGVVHPWRRGRAGTAFGRAVHEVLQSIDFETAVGIEALARSQCALEGVPEAVDAVVAHVRSALQSEIVQLAARGPSWREAYVATMVGDRVVEGYIDLLVRTPEGLIVVDYKTDGVKTEGEAAARVEHYRLQGATYAFALEASTGLSVVDVRFLFTGASRGGADRAAIDLPIADLRAAIDDVQAQLTAMSA